MQRVLLISGCKQSGKSSAMNYLGGYLLKQSGLSINGTPVSQFQLDENGNLEFDSYFVNPDTKEKVGEWSRLDITRQDEGFVDAARQFIWPVIKVQHFAELLKETAIVVFGLNREEVYGTDEQKNRLSPIKWESVYKLFPEKRPQIKKSVKKKKGEVVEAEPEVVEQPVQEYMTNREFLEVWGTDIARGLHNECWIQALFTRILSEDYPLVVVPDCRFEDEIIYGREVPGIELKVIRLLRNPFNGQHAAETNLLNYEGFDAVIDNREMTQEEKGLELVNILRSWGWIV